MLLSLRSSATSGPGAVRGFLVPDGITIEVVGTAKSFGTTARRKSLNHACPGNLVCPAPPASSALLAGGACSGHPHLASGGNRLLKQLLVAEDSVDRRLAAPRGRLAQGLRRHRADRGR